MARDASVILFSIGPYPCCHLLFKLPSTSSQHSIGKHTNKMNFAPYQDTSPEIERALSPPPQDGRRSKSPSVRSPPSSRPFSPPPGSLPPPSAFANDNAVPQVGANHSSGFGNNFENTRFNLEAFQTSLPLRMDYEAMLAYLLLPPAGGVLLLILEHKSDYVRYGYLDGYCVGY